MNMQRLIVRTPNNHPDQSVQSNAAAVGQSSGKLARIGLKADGNT